MADLDGEAHRELIARAARRSTGQMRLCARFDNCRWVCEASAAPACGRISSRREWGFRLSVPTACKGFASARDQRLIAARRVASEDAVDCHKGPIRQTNGNDATTDYGINPASLQPPSASERQPGEVPRFPPCNPSELDCSKVSRRAGSKKPVARRQGFEKR
jgi:hypothetical protein